MNDYQYVKVESFLITMVYLDAGLQLVLGQILTLLDYFGLRRVDYIIKNYRRL